MKKFKEYLEGYKPHEGYNYFIIKYIGEEIPTKIVEGFAKKEEAVNRWNSKYNKLESTKIKYLVEDYGTLIRLGMEPDNVSFWTSSQEDLFGDN